MKVMSLLLSMMVMVAAVNVGTLRAAEKNPPCNSTCCKLDGMEVLRVQMGELLPQDRVAVWSALTPEQQQKLWSLKLQQVLSLPWSADEKAYLEELRPMVDNVELFSANGNPEENPFLQEVGKYMQTGKQKFGWSDTIEYHLVGTLADFPADLLPSAN